MLFCSSLTDMSAACNTEVPLNEYHRLPTLGEVVTPIHESAVVHISECTNNDGWVFSEETSNPPNGSAITTRGAGTSNSDGVMPLSSPAPRASRGPAVFVPSLYVNTLVGLSPSRESWMKRKAEPKNISLNLVQKGHTNYNTLMTGPDTLYWRTLCDAGDDALAIDDCIDELQEDPVPYYPEQLLPTSLTEVEMIKSMRFNPVASMGKPETLLQRANGSNDRDEFRFNFEHSASASFLGYLPLNFWQQV